MVPGVKKYIFVERPGVVPIVVVDSLELLLAQFTPHPPIQVWLTVTPEHLKTKGHRSVSLFQGANYLELGIMVALEGVEFADENKPGFFEVLHEFRQRQCFAVVNTEDFAGAKDLAPEHGAAE